MWRSVDDSDSTRILIRRIFNIGFSWHKSLGSTVLLFFFWLWLGFLLLIQGTLMLLRFADATLVVGLSVSPTIFKRMMKFSAIRIGKVASRAVLWLRETKTRKMRVSGRWLTV